MTVQVVALAELSQISTLYTESSVSWVAVKVRLKKHPNGKTQQQGMHFTKTKVNKNIQCAVRRARCILKSPLEISSKQMHNVCFSMTAGSRGL